MNNELFTVKPSLTQHYGRTITKETEFDEYTEDKKIHQTMKNLVLTTEIDSETEYNGIKSTEHSVLTQEMPEGTILIWNEVQGYVIPNVPVYKLKDLEEEIKQVKEIYKDNTDINPKEWLDDFSRNERKSLFINRGI
mgnify:CR=1 FL=1